MTRARAVYLTALRIGLRYLWLHLTAKVLGRAYYERRVGALDRQSAELVKATILARQGLLIKLGQMLSNMSSALPTAYAEVLESLQDKVPARPFSEVRNTLEAELGRPLDALFTHFEPEPIAAASIGQAHRARLPDGTEVVVKVQHADIEDISRIDLEVIERIVRIAAWIFRVKGMDYVYSQVRQMIQEELDFRFEARAMQEIAANLVGEKGIVIPKVYETVPLPQQPNSLPPQQPAYSTRKVLTTAYQEGVKINNLAQIDAWGLSREILCKRLIRVWSHMVLIDGYYHADPHPGNLIVKPDGDLVLLDFGATGRLGPATRKAIPELLQGVLKKDIDVVVKAMRQMGFVAQNEQAQEVARRLMEELSEAFLQDIDLEQLRFSNVNLMEMKMQGLERLQGVFNFREMTASFQVPKEWVLLQRAVALLYGTCAQLAPEINPVAELKPFLREMLLSRAGLQQLITDTLRTQLGILLSLPSDLSQALDKLNRGTLRFQIRDFNTVALLFYRLGQQFILAISLLFCLHYCLYFYEISNERLLYISTSTAILLVLLLLRSAWGTRRMIKHWRR